MKNEKIWTVITVTLLIIIGAIAWLMQPQNGGQNHKLKVVAAENVWGDIAAQIGGDDVQVTSIIADPTTDPHLYESSAQTAAAVAQADVVIMNGLGYDDFMDRLLSASPNPHRAVISMANALHARKGDNPHFWYDLSRLDQITAAIQAVYGTQRPEAVMRFTAHVATLNDALKPMFDRALAIRKQYAGAAVAYTERVPGYLLPALSLNNQTPATFASAIEDGNEPSPADQSTMQDTIITKQVRMLLYNSQAKSPVTESVRSLAEHSGIPVVTVTETLPANMTYQVWMEGQLDAIRAALDNTK